mgnify:CR=1 FL=1
MYSIIKTGGKQYRVQEGETIFVEKLELIRLLFLTKYSLSAVKEI